MKAAIQNFANSAGMTFDYARKDYANLVDDLQLDNTHVILYPLRIKETVNEHGQVERADYEGTFFMVRPSNFDENYSGDNTAKWERYIEPIHQELKQLREYLTTCNAEYTIQQWQIDEVVNLFSVNLDGLYITFRAYSHAPALYGLSNVENVDGAYNPDPQLPTVNFMLVQADAPGSKLNRWVVGKGIPGINGGGAFIAFSNVEDPTEDADLAFKFYK